VSSILPSVREPIADQSGTIRATWYRFLAQVERLIDGAISTPGTGLDKSASGALEIADNGVTDAKLRDSAALSVIGRPLDSDGDPQDIEAGADGFVLQRDSNIVAFRIPRLPRYTVATLPSASGTGNGSRVFVTDANATTFASIVAGGGSNGVPVYSDGTNWRIG